MTTLTFGEVGPGGAREFSLDGMLDGFPLHRSVTVTLEL